MSAEWAEAVTALRALASETTGVEPAMPRELHLLEAARSALGNDVRPDRVLAAVRVRNPALVAAVTTASVVCETFFCRQPLDFHAVKLHVQQRLDHRVAAWSAGCATGEEAYSLAACLLASGCADPTVLGTDIVPRHIEIARQATYGRWSVRTAELFPLLDPLESGGVGVRSEVQRQTRFRVHNLLTPPPAVVPFDVIVCRNVLMYLPAGARARVLNHLVSAMRPDGLLILGVMDFDARALPAGIENMKIPGVQAFRMRRREPPTRKRRKNLRKRYTDASRAARAVSVRTPRPPLVPPPERKTPSELAVREHLEALAQIEAGRREHALRRLERLMKRTPEYLPARLEAALLHSGAGNVAAANALMESVLAFTEALSLDDVLDGPEALPVRYYRTAAEAYVQENRRRP